MTNIDQVKAISQQIWQEFTQQQNMNIIRTDNMMMLEIPIGVSNRHVHISRQDMDILFGQGASLTRMKAVKQPGQFAAQETVTLKGPKKEIHNVRILGPFRSNTQVEISISDSFVLGINAPIKMSGDLNGAEKIEIIGPKGSVEKENSVIVAWRHIHITPEMAKQHGLTDGQKVSVSVDGIRSGTMDNVIVRATNSSILEMHIDIEEANAYGLSNSSIVKLKT